MQVTKVPFTIVNVRHLQSLTERAEASYEQSKSGDFEGELEAFAVMTVLQAAVQQYSSYTDVQNELKDAITRTAIEAQDAEGELHDATDAKDKAVSAPDKRRAGYAHETAKQTFDAAVTAHTQAEGRLLDFQFKAAITIPHS